MNPLRHIVEPAGLLLTWQHQDEHSTSRTRRVVGVVRRDDTGSATFEYLRGTPDYDAAEKAGFKGYAAFQQKDGVTTTGVIESLLRRLPPRKREDFPEFLALHGLPHPFNYSDFALLGYTGARLPSDGFSLTPIFPEGVVPCDLLLEVAGFRYAKEAAVANLTKGDPITFAIDINNPVDPDAVSILHNGIHIGYVNRALKDTFRSWLKSRAVIATIERLNGKPERPLVYVRVSIS